MLQEDATQKFHRLAWPHMGVVLRTAKFLCRDTAEAEDLAQETMIKAFRFMDRFQEGSDVKGWLMAILRNTRIDRLRSRGKRLEDVSLEQLEVDFASKPEENAGQDGPLLEPEQILNNFSDEVMIEGLQALPEEIRWTLLLVDVEGLDHAQAAEVMDVPVGTVKSRAHRGRGMLRTYLQGQKLQTGGVK